MFSYPISAVFRETPREPRGPWAVPGTYTVRLSVDGRTLSQPLRVKLDPRVKSSAEDLRAQFERSMDVAREMARNAPLAVGLAKRIIDKGYGLDKMTFQELEMLAQSSLISTEDFREGAQALAQRRDPKFKGR